MKGRSRCYSQSERRRGSIDAIFFAFIPWHMVKMTVLHGPFVVKRHVHAAEEEEAEAEETPLKERYSLVVRMAMGIMMGQF